MSDPNSILAQPRKSSAAIPFDEVKKLFSVPIADAAKILGVCTSVLKRKCRENGYTKWPYRKIHAGKAADDVKKDNTSETTVQRMDSSSSMPPSFTIHPQEKIVYASDGSKLYTQISSQHLNKVTQPERSSTHTIHSALPKVIPNYVDEFKHGFPTNGLSSTTKKWWGTSGMKDNSNASQGQIEPGEKGQASESLTETSVSSNLEGEHKSKTEDSHVVLSPAAKLTSLRKRAAEDGCKSLGMSAGGCASQKLSKRQRSVLLQVFQSSLPNQWKHNFA